MTHANLYRAMQALARRELIRISFDDGMRRDVKGYARYDTLEIVLNPALRTPAERVRVLCHEYSHLYLEHSTGHLERAQVECEAETASALVIMLLTGDTELLVHRAYVSLWDAYGRAGVFLPVDWEQVDANAARVVEHVLAAIGC